MPKVLAVSNEVIEPLWTRQVRGHDVDLVLAAGDLPFDYLGLWTRDGMPTRWPGPLGTVNADGRVVAVAGPRVAGLGGSIRHNSGPDQWAKAQMSRRARVLCPHAVVRALEPSILVHGHIHPHGEAVPERTMGATRVINAVGYRVLEIPGASHEP
ncbi:MAG: hypothetical protein M3548_03575 [Actinomycetota bacterium]|nr:hypothetical protein [Actinomycetota bacterium]